MTVSEDENNELFKDFQDACLLLGKKELELTQANAFIRKQNERIIELMDELEKLNEGRDEERDENS